MKSFQAQQKGSSASHRPFPRSATNSEGIRKIRENEELQFSGGLLTWTISHNPVTLYKTVHSYKTICFEGYEGSELRSYMCNLEPRRSR